MFLFVVFGGGSGREQTVEQVLMEKDRNATKATRSPLFGTVKPKRLYDGLDIRT